MSWSLGRAAQITAILVFAMGAVAMGAVANKTVRELGPDWCARYMLVKYMLGMDGEVSCLARLHARWSGQTPLSRTAPF
jgi:hypothetical protein